VDFSNCIFILTANSISEILQPLLNRMEIFQINPYIEEEKLMIGKNYIVPKSLEFFSIPRQLFDINDAALQVIIKSNFLSLLKRLVLLRKRCQRVQKMH